jgi:Mrp family chromosome partitioning ATPase
VTGSDENRSLPILALPTRDQAQLLPWDSAIAKSKGVYGFDSLDPRSRPFNMIRAKLHELRVQRGWRLFGVVSATPKVGKSFITLNVAASLSRDPRFDTTAVDLDLRRASLSGILGITPTTSIKAYLEGHPGADVPTAYTLEGERLMILPTAAGPIRSAELLAGSRAQSLLRAMRVAGENSLFVVDLPPVFANDDAITTMARLDAYVIVAEEGRTTQREVKDVIGLLGTTRLAGVILNKYRGGLVSEGYGVDGYYAAGYGYNSKEEGAKE